jgi:hypothetical protein
LRVSQFVYRHFLSDGQYAKSFTYTGLSETRPKAFILTYMALKMNLSGEDFQLAPRSSKRIVCLPLRVNKG